MAQLLMRSNYLWILIVLDRFFIPAVGVFYFFVFMDLMQSFKFLIQELNSTPPNP